ncbi:MAG: 2-C-methyl-D-erythritol 4-phosphate cytidylyltransferase [Candidatus Marinimicrobia bacterium]|nr:2-C-methyl-D-erythritol 4-phosphate cytidylyltransferase [Candidatus Neomarinimicrobiota bacterium]
MYSSDNLKVAAIVPAAGQGTRLGGQTKKQFRELAGKPLLIHTLERMLTAPQVSWLVVAVPEANLDSTYEMVSEIVPDNIDFTVTVGGTTRQKSVALALQEIPEEIPIITVHDAARPLLDPAWIGETALLCTEYDGAIVAIPAVDTLKEVALSAGESTGIVEGTLARNVTWQAQTPQTFRAAILRKAVRKAEDTGLSGTDESCLVEAIGGRVAVVRGSAGNIKITSSEDWRTLEWRLTGD